MSYNLVEAGAAVGKTKSTILKAIRRGVISASRNATTGGWAIEPVELHRVFPPVSQETHGNHSDTTETAPDSAALRRELELLREERERERQDARDQIADLRRRLDTEAEERRRLTAMLTDQRAAATAPPAPPPSTSAWGRFLAWRRGR